MNQQKGIIMNFKFTSFGGFLVDERGK